MALLKKEMAFMQTSRRFLVDGAEQDQSVLAKGP